ncbi:MAG: AmmeMemoRadiSam system protein A [Pseudomonadota bacterium]
MHDAEQGRLLLALARRAIARALDPDGEPPPLAGPLPDWLMTRCATFVTLTKGGVLRGCIGTLEAHRPLLEDLEANARAAAFNDPRFPPLSAAELPAVRVEVSLLTPARPLDFRDEADLLARLRPGVDGVILEQGWHRATFLPQVWEQLPEPGEFLAHLKHKAGLSPDTPATGMRIAVYAVEKFREQPS